MGRHRSALTGPEAELKVPLLLALLNLNLFSSNESPARRIRKKEGEKEEGGGQERTKGLVDTHLRVPLGFSLVSKGISSISQT